MNVTLYTDGSCLKNPGGPGGYCAILTCKLTDGSTHDKIVRGGSYSTTNNIMELTAVLKGLEALTYSCVVDIYSDSKYVVSAFNENWIDNWKRKNWKTASGTDVKNAELWSQLDKVVKRHDCKFHWVKGHADNEFNNRCDCIAREEAEERQYMLK